jgi:hypothetical protein
LQSDAESSRGEWCSHTLAQPGVSGAVARRVSPVCLAQSDAESARGEWCGHAQSQPGVSGAVIR